MGRRPLAKNRADHVHHHLHYAVYICHRKGRIEKVCLPLCSYMLNLQESLCQWQLQIIKHSCSTHDLWVQVSKMTGVNFQLGFASEVLAVGTRRGKHRNQADNGAFDKESCTSPEQ